ncbi:MAG: hypothetical protein ISS70_02735 [Phycisphaerae bacterium]|nr:hypothetical protein [Phycisphaerae bacterium]
MSFRRVSPNFIIRIGNGKALGVSVFFACITISEFILPAIGAVGTTVSSTYYIMAGTISVSLALIASYLRGRMKLIPDSLIDEMSSDGSYSCEFCSGPKLREACDMTKPYYGNEYVSADIAEQWRMKNPKAFVQITNSTGELCACFGILALSDSFMDQYIKGKVADAQLGAEDILSYEESKKCNRLYISGVITRDHPKYVSRKRACVMIWAMIFYVKHLFALRKNRELFAVAVTKDSERILKHLGFKIVSIAKNRRDKHDMYCLNLTKTTWNEMMHKVGDYSAMCEMHLDNTTSKIEG